MYVSGQLRYVETKCRARVAQAWDAVIRQRSSDAMLKPVGIIGHRGAVQGKRKGTAFAALPRPIPRFWGVGGTGEMNERRVNRDLVKNDCSW